MDLQPLLLSMQVTTLATALAAIFGVLLGWLLAKRAFPGRELLDVIVTAPMVMPPTVLGYYVLVALGRRSALGRAFESITGTQIVFTFTGAVVAAFIGALPLIVKSARAALESVDDTFLFAARTLGAGTLRTFLVIHLPLAGRGIIAGIMLGFARSLGDFGVTYMVAGDMPGETQTASIAIYDAIQARRDSEALGLVLILTSAAILILYTVNKLTARRDAIQ